MKPMLLFVLERWNGHCMDVCFYKEISFRTENKFPLFGDVLRVELTIKAGFTSTNLVARSCCTSSPNLCSLLQLRKLLCATDHAFKQSLVSYEQIRASGIPPKLRFCCNIKSNHMILNRVTSRCHFNLSLARRTNRIL